MPTPPDLAAVKTYLGLDVDDHSRDVEIGSALATETANQRRVVRRSAFGIDPVLAAQPVAYPPDLAEALCRRVARNLALRGLPLATLQSDSEAGPLVLPGKDPEVRRLEGPVRRVTVG